ncbi:hypothetical protein EDF56_104307 [Novosphingobium sp. PhB165]|uniref:DUF4350 domain-containing protein n=1 Tax=Novosphingobium sp. PhB165 TaxID=2485105 RepID=UPI001048F6D1|nr:DUF4350 domain-containing protein [Novosphingobium sp. PhB165]TCM18774.1 hypothetical protein EDF56_104307 [Novosphingobium sp. PhB165]
MNGDLPSGTVAVGANPFSRWSVLAVVLLGCALFVALLWMIGTGTGFGETNDGQAHAEGRGLNGYAAMATYLERRGYAVRRSRNEGALDKPGLLVLTPPPFADGKEIDKIVSRRRYVGPTLVISPKWFAFAASREQQQKGAKTGWVNLAGPRPPEWRGFLDDLTVGLNPTDPHGARVRWSGMGVQGALPGRQPVLWGKGRDLVPLVRDGNGNILAGFMADGGHYPVLEQVAGVAPDDVDPQDRLQPIMMVFDPDLVNNWGMADQNSARLIDALVAASGARPGDTITFDLTLNGFGNAQNLLTLAFTPPFLAATLCLLLAALVLGWRAFLRFGPPLAEGRAIAFGKRALVANAAGLVRRTGRLHLIARPYADHARERLVRALALPRTLDGPDADAAIDRALASRDPAAEPFSAIAARLRQARRPQDLVKAARDLHALERMLTR